MDRFFLLDETVPDPTLFEIDFEVRWASTLLVLERSCSGGPRLQC
jgi:hypothetical protein